jgi:hypothetical protein
MRNEIFYPITRSIATEETHNIPKNLTIKKSIHRLLIINYERFRITANKEECAKGIKFYIAGEVEYDAYTSYDNILNLEDRLMEMMKDYSSYLNLKNLH